MKEILQTNGWEKKGGCRCQGGADYYFNDTKINYRVEVFYKANFWTLSFRYRKIKRGTINDLQKTISEI